MFILELLEVYQRKVKILKDLTSLYLAADVGEGGESKVRVQATATSR